VASHPHRYDGVFAIYPIVVAAVLVGFGDVSDYVGRRTAILWGVGASLVGTLLFALAPDVLWLSSKIYDQKRMLIHPKRSARRCRPVISVRERPSPLP